MIDYKEIFHFFKNPKKQTYLVKGFYNNVIFFKPGQDLFPKFRRHFATRE